MNSNAARFARLGGLLLLAGALGSCAGVRFDRDWEAAKKFVPAHFAESAAAISGAWEGRWASHSNGHSGKLRCLVTPDAAGRTALFRYEATWGEVFTGRFNIRCDLTAAGKGVWKVSGTKDLGKLFGGEFGHTATLSASEFKAEYTSKLDRGTLTLHRVKP